MTRVAGLAEGVRGSDLVVLAVPVGRLEAVAGEAAAVVDAATVVTDVGSVKAPVVKRLEPLFARFVGGHPMAGSERSGVTAASPSLFEGARCVLTPTSRTDVKALGTVERLWTGLGASVMHLDPDAHDELAAAVSHLPHLAAASLVNAAAGVAGGRAFSIAAAGFRDATRIASGSPELWKDICLMNRGPLLKVLTGYVEEIERLRRCLDRSDGQGLLEELTRARASRERLKEGHA